MPLPVTAGVSLPDSDLTLSFIRAAGPGGQNVNKVASAVQLRFDLAGTQALHDRVKTRLRTLAGRRLTQDGAILIIARNHRTQEQNRDDALSRLVDLLRQATQRPTPRRPTKPSRAARQRRLDSKTRRGTIKRLRRGKPDMD